MEHIRPHELSEEERQKMDELSNRKLVDLTAAEYYDYFWLRQRDAFARHLASTGR